MLLYHLSIGLMKARNFNPYALPLVRYDMPEAVPIPYARDSLSIKAEFYHHWTNIGMSTRLD
jgi:hypothetical protein